MRVYKQNDSTEKRKTERTRGVAEKRLENLGAEKSEAKSKNNPQRMLQTVNGWCKPIKM